MSEVSSSVKTLNKASKIPKGIYEMCKKWSSTKLPDDIFISTITIICKLNSLIDVNEVIKNIDLKEDKIMYIRGMGVFKSLVKRRKKKETKNSFHNQISIGIMVDKIISIKLFINGSIQITGCKKIDDAVLALEILFNELKMDGLTLQNINNLRVVMINSNFNIGFKIDRDKLFNLIKSNVSCSYDKSIHACVDIKYTTNDKIVSIFVFESGSIVITGANTLEHINNSYNFISRILLENYKKIVKRNALTNSVILTYMK